MNGDDAAKAAGLIVEGVYGLVIFKGRRGEQAHGVPGANGEWAMENGASVYASGGFVTTLSRRAAALGGGIGGAPDGKGAAGLNMKDTTSAHTIDAERSRNKRCQPSA